MTTILQINSRVNVGSVSRITEHIGQLVLQNGWESYIAYGRDSRLSQSKLIRIGTNWDVYAHKFYSLLLDRQGLASVSSTKQLIKDIIVIKPDLIHLQNIHGYYLNYKLLFDFCLHIMCRLYGHYMIVGLLQGIACILYQLSVTSGKLDVGIARCYWIIPKAYL